MRKAWKLYFGYMIVIYVIDLLKLLEGLTAMKVAGLIFNALVLVALYGFCFNRKIGERTFWKIGFIVALFQEVIFSIVQVLMLYPENSWVLITVCLIYLIPVIVPIYVAMYLYAFKREDIW